MYQNVPSKTDTTNNQLSNQSNLSLYSLYYAEACNEFAGPICALLRPGSTALFEERLQQWRAVCNTVSNFTSPRFEPQTYRSKDESVITQPTRWSNFVGPCRLVTGSLNLATGYFEPKVQVISTVIFNN